MLALSAAAGIVSMMLAWLSIMFLGIATIAAVAWWTGVFHVTKPRQVTGAPRIVPEREARIERLAARLTQAAWIPACLLAIATVELASVKGVSTAPVFMVAMMWLGCVGTALAGLVPLCVALSNIAHWGMETNLANHFRMAAMSMAICGGLVAVSVFVLYLTQTTMSFAFIGGLAGMVFFLFSSLFLLGLAYFVILLFQLAHMVRWAIINADATLERTERLAARVARAESRAKLEQFTPAPQGFVDNDDPIPLAEPDPPETTPYDRGNA
jgi:hypothetical protein